jgi:hypothetical protein
MLVSKMSVGSNLLSCSSTSQAKILEMEEKKKKKMQCINTKMKRHIFKSKSSNVNYVNFRQLM